MNYRHEVSAKCEKHNVQMWLVELERGKTAEICRSCEEESRKRIESAFTVVKAEELQSILDGKPQYKTVINPKDHSLTSVEVIPPTENNQQAPSATVDVDALAKKIIQSISELVYVNIGDNAPLRKDVEKKVSDILSNDWEVTNDR